MKKSTVRMDWVNGCNRVFITDAAGVTADVSLEDFVRIADFILTNTFEVGNPCHRATFKKLPKLVHDLDQS